ncbi:hypothetical protein K4F52_004536 [Lecanicillium sp. MT-2017a]|nr:hypothetical protein K4F52_004536 [Lecanicillium sp. MT-2017a]
MHVLSGFSQRRKSPNKPRDLHIRKISFSGCSLSSGCSWTSDESSFSSSASTERICHSRSGSGASGASFDPLRLHPVSQPPPRLHERPFIVSPTSTRHYSHGTTFYDDGVSEVGSAYQGYSMSVFDYDDSDTEVDDEDDGPGQPPAVMELPPLASPMDHDTNDKEEAQDYFFLTLAKRPPMPRSHWSESTIQTLGQLTPAVSSATTPRGPVAEDAAVEQARMMLPNFSYKRATVPKRPQIKPMDSVEQLVKRGGWKRRAVLLDGQEADDAEA